MRWHDVDRFLARFRRHREALSLVIDCATVVVCWYVTYLFRLGFERWHVERAENDSWVIVTLVAVYAGAFLFFGVPKGMWRFSGFGEIKRLTVACVLGGSVGAAIVIGAEQRDVPRAVLALHPFITLMGLATTRIGYRMLYEHARGSMAAVSGETRRALILGAGDAARLLIAGIRHEGWQVVGCLDDDPNRQGARIGGVLVHGRLDDVEDVARELEATHILIAMPAAQPAQRRRAMDLAAQSLLPVLTVPTVRELQSGSEVTSVRDIEPEDLLGREPVELDEAGISDAISGRVVMITGAGGSIGSELCRQVARYGPKQLILYELNEFNLYTIEQDLAERYPRIPLVCLMGDVKNREHLEVTFATYRPHVVFHAAAYKHVPLMEQSNAWAAIANNTLGTRNVAEAAQRHEAERFVLISTDKAVNPTNVMGATKRAAEMVIGALATTGGRTKFMAVRFGNVLGSSGSVIPKFKEQIAKGGPVTVTHPDITRYFMTIPEAARLVIQAAAIGESGQVFVLDMGDPVRIADLAADLIRMAGHSTVEIPIVYSGLRPGEKLYEELLADSDTTVPTRIERLRIAKLSETNTLPEAWIRRVADIPSHPLQDDEIRTLLREVVPEYQPAA